MLQTIGQMMMKTKKKKNILKIKELILGQSEIFNAHQMPDISILNIII